MNNPFRSLLVAASQLLDHDERDAVLGDLVEAKNGPWHDLLDIADLIARRQAALWMNWRPWMATLGLAIPSSFLLMGLSVSVSWSYLHRPDQRTFEVSGLLARPDLVSMIFQLLLLVGCAWTCGFVLGSLSRKTLWLSLLAAMSPCLFCLSRFGIPSLSRFCLLLFLLPAIGGAWQSIRGIRMHTSFAVALAIALTGIMLSTSNANAFWIFNCTLVWPAWYVAVRARRSIS